MLPGDGKSSPALWCARDIQREDIEMNECLNCEGTGRMRCSLCGGQGRRMKHTIEPVDFLYTQFDTGLKRRVCDRCDGSGEEECDECFGEGRV